MAELNAWGSFYEIVGFAAGALIGLQFVVLTLIAERPARDGGMVGAAFSTPTIVHFSAVLLLSALARAPWRAMTLPAILWGLMGLAGAAYTVNVARRMRRQTAYAAVLEDWVFHLAVPLAAYAGLALAAFAAETHARPALFAVGAAALLLLFTGIHNAWDGVAYHVLARSPDKT